jgi:hypothetical protein
LIGPALAAALTAAVALVPPRSGPLLRDSDYAVGNAIALHRAQERAQAGDLDAALRTIRVQLRTEPAELRRLAPTAGESRLSESAARVASLFVDLHRLAASVHERRDEREEAWSEGRQAQLLEVVARQYRARHPEAGS